MRRSTLVAIIAVAAVLAGTGTAAAQTGGKPRRQFITVSLDNLWTQPLHFAQWPVEDLVGREVAEAQGRGYDYESRDGQTAINVLEFRKRGRGWGVTVYPLGMSVGPTLGIRAGREDLPVIRLAMSGPSNVSAYALTDAYAIDVAALIVVADRSRGWGLGSRAFVGGGAGKVRSSLGDGRRLFAEGGGGLSIGPLAVELSVKFAWNRLDEPVEHRFFTVPVAIRTSVSF